MKTRLWSTFNAAVHFGGQAFSYAPPLFLLFVAAFGVAMGGGADITSSDVAITAGISGASLGVGALGYSRVVGESDKAGMKRSKLAHAFNFVASNIGAGVAAIAGLTLFGMATDSSTAYTLPYYLNAAIALAGGLVLFGVGHRRIFGKPSFDDAVEMLREYKKHDPNFEKAIKEVAESEAAISPKDDPVEGTVIKDPNIEPKP